MELSDVNLLEDTWWGQVPHEMFDLLRAEAPVYWHDDEPDAAHRRRRGPGGQDGDGRRCGSRTHLCARGWHAVLLG